MERTTPAEKTEPRARRGPGRQEACAPPLPLHVERKNGEWLHRQVYSALVELIRSGRVRPGVRLPASRALAEELGVARNTVLLALDELISEGYVETRRGSGTYVCAELPDRPPVAVPRAPPGSTGRRPRLAARAKGLVAPANQPLTADGLLRPGEPDLSSFPFKVWARLLWESWRRPPESLLSGKDAAGYPPLRAAVADYLSAARNVTTTAEQVVIVAGIRQALTVAARLVLETGDVVWLEDPGYRPLRAPLIAAGAKLAPIPLDEEGLSIRDGRRMAPRPKLICVVPSHQYPLGITMSSARRHALMAYARQVNAWIFEDDYEHEWRYAGGLPAAIQSLDRDGRVLYAGTFSKMLFPSIRLGYVVVPKHLQPSFVAALQALDDQPSMLLQPALAAFIAEGYLGTHLRRQRRSYKMKQDLLLAAAWQHLRGLLELKPDPGGQHLIGYLHPDLLRRMDDREASWRAAAVGISVPALSQHSLANTQQQGLVIGYTALAGRQIDVAVRRLAQALTQEL